MIPKDKDKVEKDKGENKHSDKNSAPAPVIKEEKEAPLSAVKTEKEEKEEADKEVEEEKDPLEVIRERTGIVVKTGAGFESRWSTTVLEEENFQPDCASLNLVQECQDNLGKRAVAVSTIFRNLSFVPGNESILSSSPGFLAVCGKMLLHHHWHPPRTSKQRNYDRGEEEDFTESCTSLSDQPEWWWDHLQVCFFHSKTNKSSIANSSALTGAFYITLHCSIRVDVWQLFAFFPPQPFGAVSQQSLMITTTTSSMLCKSSIPELKLKPLAQFICWTCQLSEHITPSPTSPDTLLFILYFSAIC